MSEKKFGLEEIYNEVQALKDLFLRRLVDDKVKVAAIAQLSSSNERLTQTINDMYFISFMKELFLICDRIEANPNADDFALSIHDELLEIFGRRGIYPITDTRYFNPSIHNAVKTVSAEGEISPGSIVYTQRTGYVQGEKVLRPADVVVATEQ